MSRVRRNFKKRVVDNAVGRNGKTAATVVKKSVIQANYVLKNLAKPR